MLEKLIMKMKGNKKEISVKMTKKKSSRLKKSITNPNATNEKMVLGKKIKFENKIIKIQRKI